MILRYLSGSANKSMTRRGVKLTATAQINHLKRKGIIAATTTAYPRYCYYSTTHLVLDDKNAADSAPYKTPASVLEWEKGATKELSRSKKLNVDYLRTQRLTAEGIAIQPVYYDWKNDENPEMPGVYPYTRGPYAVRKCCGTSWPSSVLHLC